MPDLDRPRLKIRPMLDLSAPADALYAYYAFYHDPARSELYVHEDDAHQVDGFVAVCQTGQRLFQPTVALRTAKAEVADDLLHQALTPGRSYYVITTPDLRDVVTESVQMEQWQINRVYRIDLSRFEYAINVLVVPERGVGDRPRFVIRSQEKVAAEASTVWLSPHFAAISVRATSAAQRRSWDRSVLEACTRWVVRSGRQALVIVGEKDTANVALAETVGYVDTGAREFAGEGVCCL